MTSRTTAPALDPANIQQTAVMNDVFANDHLEAGRLMKIAVSQPYRDGNAR
jgi:hypothetical protein